MNYRWILFAVGAAALGLSAWYFGRPVAPRQEKPAPLVGAAQPTTAESAKEQPPKVIEVIDLARAYEPVRELEPISDAVNPASFIEEQYAPRRIPMAVEDANEFNDLLMRIREAPTGSFLFGISLPKVERIDVPPREVRASNERGSTTAESRQFFSFWVSLFQ
jgi:hypothetical protein